MRTASAAELEAASRRVKLICVDVDGTLTDGGMYYSAQGEELKRFDTRDAMGLLLLRKAGIAVAICTSENSPIVAARARKLQIEDCLLGIKDKVAAIGALLAQHGLDWPQLAYVGDDVNDQAVLAKAGLSACPADAPGKTPAQVMYVCNRLGGHGAVREVCELILAALQTQPQAAAETPGT